MKYIIGIIVVIMIIGCNSSKVTSGSDEIVPTETKMDTIRIENEELEYEIIIIESGFDSWLITQKPMWYYSNNTLRIKNNFYVIEWNQRVTQPFLYNPALYEQLIDYNQNIDYGIEVNYKLYQYFQYFQKKYRQKLY